jgi:glyoxylase-like metal-dependent hydrolase (beta-lactamase superfamily II)
VKIESRTVGAFQENSYLLVDPATKRAVLVDPGAEAQELIAMVRQSGASLEAIWLTHAHIDHIGAIAEVKRTWNVPVYLHPADQPLYDRGAMQAAVYGLPFEQPPAPERELADGDVLTLGNLTFDVLHVPGHAPGHVVFVGQGNMIGGDLLFAGSIGRTDLPFSDPNRMMDSLERVSSLPEATVVHPGHGPATTIGVERATNPFLNGVARVVRR